MFSHLELTPEGRAIAVRVMRKHRLAERLLADVIGLDWALVHDEACRWEHVMSEEVERRLLEVLNFPTESPYGNPIPGLDELGVAAAPPFMSGVQAVSEALTDQLVATIRRLGEPLQFDAEVLRQFAASGVAPGSVATFTRDGESVVITVGTATPVRIPIELSNHVYVALI